MPSPAATPPPPENILLNLACNVVAPALMLMKGGKWLSLPPKTALLVALAFPLAYGIYDLARRRTFNFLSALGFLSTLATGGLGLLKLEPFWFAVKEAAVPTLVGLTVVASQLTKKSLMYSLLEQAMDANLFEAALAERGQTAAFKRLVTNSTWLFAGSFVFSAVLNFILARIIITAMPETDLFNEQLGRLTWISYIVIAIPSLAIAMVALWRLLVGLEKLTGLQMDDLLRHPPQKPRESAPTGPNGPDADKKSG